MNLIPIISDLLLRYQRATIPEFGTFLIAKRPAQLNKITRVLSPPGITLKFDKNQKTDDGKLSEYLIKKLKISNGSALKGISEFSQEALKQLNAKGIVTFEGLGNLKVEKSGDYSFAPDEEMLKRINLFELPKVTITSETPSQQVNKLVVPVSTLNNVIIEKRKKRRLLIPAIILLLITGIGVLVYYSGIYRDIASIAESAFNNKKQSPEEKKMVFGKRISSDSSTISKDTLKEIISRELDDRTNREKALAYKENVPQNNNQIKPVKTETLKPINSNLQYHIIAGAFLVPNNAERQKSVLEKKGYAAVILPKRGDYYMVSVGSYDSNENASRAMLQIENNLNKKLWILKIK